MCTLNSTTVQLRSQNTAQAHLDRLGHDRLQAAVFSFSWLKAENGGARVKPLGAPDAWHLSIPTAR